MTIIMIECQCYFIKLSSSKSCDSSRLHIGEAPTGEGELRWGGLCWRGLPSSREDAEKEEKKAEARWPPERRLNRAERRRAGRRSGEE